MIPKRKSKKLLTKNSGEERGESNYKDPTSRHEGVRPDAPFFFKQQDNRECETTCHLIIKCRTVRPEDKRLRWTQLSTGSIQTTAQGVEFGRPKKQEFVRPEPPKRRC